MKNRRIVFVGGGSGGHFYPLMAIAEAVINIAHAQTQEPPSLYYMGPEAYDKTTLDALGISFVFCPAGKRRRYTSIQNYIDIFKTLFGLFFAFFTLLKIYPDVIMSKGGHTSIPVVFASWILRIPILVHESDAVPGKANLFGSKFARYVAISYPDAAEHFPSGKTVLTGIPIRTALTKEQNQSAAAQIGIDPNRATLLVLGGSQGAERVNRLILESLDELLPIYNVIHQTGKASFYATTEAAKTLISAELLKHYHPVAFLSAETLNDAMSVAAIIISRAGSTSIYEIAFHGKPSVLIPIPEEISHDQRTNAYAYARTGAASVMEEANLRDGLLMAEITRIMGDRDIYNQMSLAARAFGAKNAGTSIAKKLIEIADEHY